jgi:hypothetical protein
MYLSPRGVYCAETMAFQCCKGCVKVINVDNKPSKINLPWFAIANGAMFGEAPSVLTDLNDAELALVSLARTNKHVFAFYGGAHKSMCGWHNMYENDVTGIARTLSQATELGGRDDILCVLMGPFTPVQREYVKSRMMIRVDCVLNALRWLKRNNPLYNNITMPSESELPRAVIIDEGLEAESENTNIES